MNSAKKQRKTIERERLEISLRKLEIGTFHAKMGTIKDRNGMNLTEAVDTKKEVGRIHRIVHKRS